MKDNLESAQWIDRLLMQGPDVIKNVKNIPVVIIKVVFPDGKIASESFAIVTPTSNNTFLIRNEVDETGAHLSCDDVEKKSLEIGNWENHFGIKCFTEFDGFAGDEKHKKRKWSYTDI